MLKEGNIQSGELWSGTDQGGLNQGERVSLLPDGDVFNRGGIPSREISKREREREGGQGTALKEGNFLKFRFQGLHSLRILSFF